MKGEDEGVLQEERKGEKRELHSPELDGIWHEMSMSFLEVERRAAVAHPAPCEDQVAIFREIQGLGTGCQVPF